MIIDFTDRNKTSSPIPIVRYVYEDDLKITEECYKYLHATKSVGQPAKTNKTTKSNTEDKF